MCSLHDKVFLITGASSGIGEALAKELVKRGAKVGLLARRKQRLQALEKLLNQTEERAFSLVGDVTQEKQLKLAVQKLKNKFGQIDGVIANAGFGVAGKFEELTEADYRRQFETNVFGVLKTITASLDEIKKTQGTLVIVGSVVSHLSPPGFSAYSMSKYALRALADSLRVELKSVGVSVVLISPGIIQTEFNQIDNQGHLREKATPHPLAWLALSAEQAAQQIVEAIERKTPEAIITFHGKILVLLSRLAPSVLRWALNRIMPRSAK